MEKMVRGFSEAQEETIGVFALIVVEPSHRGWTQEPMEKSSAVSPLVSVSHEGNVPGSKVHA